jgi:CHAT domain
MTDRDSTASARGELGVDAGHALPVDLEVTVVDRAYDDQHFKCIVAARLLDDYQEKVEEDWILPTTTREILGVNMDEFTSEVEAGSRLLSLLGAGGSLWKVAPERFKSAFEELVKTGRPPEIVKIVSQEPNIPWELMIPEVEGEDDIRPLGVRCSISRWYVDGAPLRTPGSPRDARIVAPRHNEPPDLLKFAAAEARAVRTKVGSGKRIRRATPTHLQTELNRWSGTVLHFVCHGEGGAGQTLLLDGKERLSAAQVDGMGKLGLKAAWRETAPIVFLNACDAGRTIPTLSGAGGLVKAWADAGAGAVIAPIWSVDDRIAHKVALKFYDRIKDEPSVRYAAIVRDIRAEAYASGEDTYAAYCYFGSPFASAAEEPG